jgi:hypothetical protein
MNRTAPPTTSSGQPSSSQTMESPNNNMDMQNQMVQKFSQQSGMNIEYSKLLVSILLFKYIFDNIHL